MQTLRDELRAVPSIVGRAPSFDLASAPDEPHELFVRWLQHAIEAEVPEANAATLSTVDEEGLPDARVLTVRDVTEDCGFKIATSDQSAKGHQLSANPHCALTFYWSPLARAVRARGVAQRAPAAESAEDFLARHPHTRAIALAGQQSAIYSDDGTQEELLTQAMGADAGTGFPHWSVWTVVPNSIEFWQGDPSRNHQRLRYIRTGDTWERQRLWP